MKRIYFKIKSAVHFTHLNTVPNPQGVRCKTKSLPTKELDSASCWHCGHNRYARNFNQYKSCEC